MDPSSVLVAGTASPALAASMAGLSDGPIIQPECRTFPDGELYVHMEGDFERRTVYIVQSTVSSDAFVELLLLQDAVREAGAARVVAVIPYYGYARQDRVFKPGEAVSSRAIARALAATADAMFTVDPHKEGIVDFFGASGHHVSAVPELAKELGIWGVDAILAPDKGARDRAQAAAHILDVPFDHLEKTRLGPTEVRMETKELEVEGQRVAILDDMIASGATMVKAAGQLKDQGAKAVYAACTHGLFTGGAVPRLLAGGIDRVMCTDTVEGPQVEGCAVVPAAPAIIPGLRDQLQATL